MGRLGSIAASATLAFGLAGFAPAALAQGDICDHLESRLIALDSSPGSASELGKYREADRAVRRQMRELDQAIEDGRRAGCLGGFLAQFKKGGNCGRVTANINRMRANLDRLTRARDRYSADPLDDSRERGELVSALAENGCGAQYETFDRPSRRPGIFARFFDGPIFRERGGWGDPFFGGGYGTYRTLCVRTCDGYYFPISFSTTQSNFAADEATCQAQCPGTEVALYVHHSPGEESDAMVSLAGEPYSALPAAFRYRETYDKSCSCGKIAASAAPMTPMPAETGEASGPDPWGFARTADPAAPFDGYPPVPPARPGAEDPETLANRAGSFQPTIARGPAPAAAVVELKPAGERTVRIVGPSYFYAQ
jgi:hypothetical protein